MFSPQTQATIAQNLAAESGQYGFVTLPAEVYRELLQCARSWDAYRSAGSPTCWGDKLMILEIGESPLTNG